MKRSAFGRRVRQLRIVAVPRPRVTAAPLAVMTSDDQRREFAELAELAGAGPGASPAEQLDALAVAAEAAGHQDIAAEFRTYAWRARGAASATRRPS
jgi:hypothetical protein